MFFSLSAGFEQFWVTQRGSVPNFRDIQTLYPYTYKRLELWGYADNLTTRIFGFVGVISLQPGP